VGRFARRREWCDDAGPARPVHIVRGLRRGGPRPAQRSLGEVSAASGGGERLFEILHSIRDSPLRQRRRAFAQAGARRSSCSNNISFAYPTRPDALAVDGVSLSVRAGEKVAIVGPPVRQEHAVSLLLRFYDPLPRHHLVRRRAGPRRRSA